MIPRMFKGKTCRICLHFVKSVKAACCCIVSKQLLISCWLLLTSAVDLAGFSLAVQITSVCTQIKQINIKPARVTRWAQTCRDPHHCSRSDKEDVSEYCRPLCKPKTKMTHVCFCVCPTLTEAPPSLLLSADIDSQHRWWFVVIPLEPNANRCPWWQQQPLQCDHMPFEVHYVITCGDDGRNLWSLCKHYDEISYFQSVSFLFLSLFEEVWHLFTTEEALCSYWEGQLKRGRAVWLLFSATRL